MFGTAALSLAVGIMRIWKPAEGTVSLLPAFGARYCGTRLSDRSDVLSLCHAKFVGLVLAADSPISWPAGLFIYSWPASASWTLGLIVGINLITTGMAIVMTAMEVRNVAEIQIAVFRVRLLSAGSRPVLPDSAPTKPGLIEPASTRARTYEGLVRCRPAALYRANNRSIGLPCAWITTACIWLTVGTPRTLRSSHRLAV